MSLSTALTSTFAFSSFSWCEYTRALRIYSSFYRTSAPRCTSSFLKKNKNEFNIQTKDRNSNCFNHVFLSHLYLRKTYSLGWWRRWLNLVIDFYLSRHWIDNIWFHHETAHFLIKIDETLISYGFIILYSNLQVIQNAQYQFLYF